MLEAGWWKREWITANAGDCSNDPSMSSAAATDGQELHGGQHAEVWAYRWGSGDR